MSTQTRIVVVILLVVALLSGVYIGRISKPTPPTLRFAHELDLGAFAANMRIHHPFNQTPLRTHIATARDVCTYLDQGISPARVEGNIFALEYDSYWSRDDASFFVGLATRVFCREHEHLLEEPEQ